MIATRKTYIQYSSPAGSCQCVKKARRKSWLKLEWCRISGAAVLGHSTRAIPALRRHGRSCRPYCPCCPCLPCRVRWCQVSCCVPGCCPSTSMAPSTPQTPFPLAYGSVHSSSPPVSPHVQSVESLHILPCSINPARPVRFNRSRRNRRLFAPTKECIKDFGGNRETIIHHGFCSRPRGRSADLKEQSATIVPDSPFSNQEAPLVSRYQLGPVHRRGKEPAHRRDRQSLDGIVAQRKHWEPRNCPRPSDCLRVAIIFASDRRPQLRLRRQADLKSVACCVRKRNDSLLLCY